MSEQKHLTPSAAVAAALFALALAPGCQMFRPKPASEEAIVTSSSATEDVRQASFEPDDPEKERPLGLEDFSPDKITKTAKRLVGQAPNKKAARKSYDEADALYRQAASLPEGDERQRLFLDAAGKFLQAAEQLPSSAIEQDSLFMAGEAYFFADYYWEANRSYEKLVKAYPNNRYLDTADARRFAIARYWLDMTKKEPESWYAVNLFDQARPWRDSRGHGLRVFDKIRIDDPIGRLSDDATLAAANEYFAAGKFYKADEYYTDLRTSYPTSEHQFLGHFLGLKAKLMCYIGPDYSGTSLDEGEKLIRQMRRAFPEESAKEKEFLDRAAAEIRYKKAEKLWHWAEYYNRRQEYRAAGNYYRRIEQEYSDTPFAKQAAARQNEIAGKPPVPPQKFEWLTKIIPTNDKIQPMIDAAKKKDPNAGP